MVSNPANKVALSAYQAAESPLKQLSRRRTLPNFKDSTSIRLGELGKLAPLSEAGEIVATSRAETGETLRIGTFARRLDVTRKLLIDDELNLFGDMTAAVGQAAAQTEADLMVALITGNPVMSDGDQVFDSDRGNVSTPSALNVANLGLAHRAMRERKGLDGATPINAVPAFLLVGPELETLAEQVLSSIYAAETADVNPFAGKLRLLVEPRITGNDWWVFSDPARLATLQHAYLSSAQGVQIQRQEAWNTLGLSFRAFLDFGAGWVDWRGAQYNAGGRSMALTLQQLTTARDALMRARADGVRRYSDHPHPQEQPSVERGLLSRPGAQRNPACHTSIRQGVLEAVDRIPCPQPRRSQDALAGSLEPVALHRFDLKSFGERIAARDPDRQTAEIHTRVALMNRFNVLGTAEIVRVA